MPEFKEKVWIKDVTAKKTKANEAKTVTETELWQINALMEEIDEDEKYTDWEQKFVHDLAERAERFPDYELSEKQADCLQRIYDK